MSIPNQKIDAHRRATSVQSPATRPLHVVVASQNIVKINAAKSSVDRCLVPIYGQCTYDTASVPSGVPDQPMGDLETLQGARNRAIAALKQHPGSLVIAIEGGVGPRLHTTSDSRQQHRNHQQQQQVSQECASEQQLECFAWVVVQHGLHGPASEARSASFLLPPAVSKLVLSGMELGHADDMVFKRTRSGQGSGTVGVLSHGLITRQAYYEHAVTLALLPYMNPQLYPEATIGSGAD